jgi:hypothetical protein
MNQERLSFFRTIRFPKPADILPKGHALQYHGEHGEGAITGVEITLHGNFNKVVVHPLNERDNTSEYCRMEVPFNKATLLELSAKFAHLADMAP